jgi:hypothetical protein
MKVPSISLGRVSSVELSGSWMKVGLKVKMWFCVYFAYFCKNFSKDLTIV